MGGGRRVDRLSNSDRQTSLIRKKKIKSNVVVGDYLIS